MQTKELKRKTINGSIQKKSQTAENVTPLTTSKSSTPPPPPFEKFLDPPMSITNHYQ
jgi:hypothetical protein